MSLVHPGSQSPLDPGAFPSPFGWSPHDTSLLDVVPESPGGLMGLGMGLDGVPLERTTSWGGIGLVGHQPGINRDLSRLGSLEFINSQPAFPPEHPSYRGATAAGGGLGMGLGLGLGAGLGAGAGTGESDFDLFAKAGAGAGSNS